MKSTGHGAHHRKCPCQGSMQAVWKACLPRQSPAPQALQSMPLKKEAQAAQSTGIYALTRSNLKLTIGRHDKCASCMARQMTSCTFLQAKNSIACCLQRRVLCLVWLQPACAIAPESSIVACVCSAPHACLSAAGIQQPLCFLPCGLQATEHSWPQVVSKGPPQR